MPYPWAGDHDRVLRTSRSRVPRRKSIGSAIPALLGYLGIYLGFLRKSEGRGYNEEERGESERGERGPRPSPEKRFLTTNNQRSTAFPATTPAASSRIASPLPAP